ncbi:ABC transporter permease [Enterococcus faecalis]|uniref:ABC transporter permease n=1 Tax=Enterococcus faecalis TaxID=1351 RepID=UPI00032E7BB9|nr:ABC transporter permease [Enterococcus faecalis]EOI33261.1 hypothetical protein UE5_00750 [Enterococcus faecalis EnGen0249]EOJ23889.1 hypothetical protein UO1_00749 [Enterococcus faecalis EnGen0284]
MGQLLICELKKLKRSNVFWIILAGAFFSAFMTYVQFVMAQSVDSQSTNFVEFYMGAIWNNFFVAFPFSITIIGGMIFNQEYSNATLKSIMTVPVSIKSLSFAKVIIIGILAFILSLTNFIFVVIGAGLLHLPEITVFHLIKSLLQICGIGMCIYIAVLPLIIWGFRKLNGYYPMMCLAFMYGFCGNFLIPRGLGDYYPVTAGLRIIQYDVLPQGNNIAAYVTILAMLIISVLMICFIPYSYEKAIHLKAKKKTKKK